jgi:hypothetical protein
MPVRDRRSQTGDLLMADDDGNHVLHRTLTTNRYADRPITPSSRPTLTLVDWASETAGLIGSVAGAGRTRCLPGWIWTCAQAQRLGLTQMGYCMP